MNDNDQILRFVEMKRSALKRSAPMKRTEFKRKPSKPKPEQQGADQPKKRKPIKYKPDGSRIRAKKALILENDRIMSRICRRIGRCEACAWEMRDSRGSVAPCEGETPSSLQWCHIKGRSSHRLRWDDQNCVCMCARHHRYFTNNPIAFGAFVEQHAPGTYDYIARREREPFKTSQEFLETENKRLRDSAELLGVAWR